MSKFITLTWCAIGSPVNYKVRADQIVSFSWVPCHAATAVMMKNGTVVYVTDTPARIEKKIAKARKDKLWIKQGGIFDFFMASLSGC